MKNFYLFLLALVCTMASWAAPTTTDWIDYTQTFHNGTWTNASGGGNAISGYLRKVVSTTPEGYFPVTIEVTTAENYLGYATQAESGSNVKYKRPWFKAGKAFSISVPQGVKIVAYEMQTKTSNGAAGSTFKYTAADGTMVTSPAQSGTLQKITVENLDANSFMIDMSGYTASNGVLLFTLRLKLQYERVNVTINAHEGNNSETAFSGTVSMFTGEQINIAEALPASVLVRYTDKIVDVTTEGQTIDVSYTDAIPFATSYKALNDGDKWVSFFTKQGRMHVYDDKCMDGATKKYPSIDKATFTNLTDNKFWGFICENPLQSSVVKIVNKGAGETKGTLYMTTNNAANTSNDPLLLAAERGSNITNEWVIEKGQTDQTTGTQYYVIKANGYSKYINNYQGAGFMTTWKDGYSDGGSNIKFTSELDTYVTLKERALNAPKGAVHSLNDFARQVITNNSDNTVAGYKKVIDDINDVDTDAGFIQFTDGGYYYLQNYTPAGADKTFMLGSDNGTAARTYEVTSGAATAANAMDYTNLNAIWKITEDVDAPPYEVGSDNIGVSKTIGRYVTHVNSANKLYEITRSAISSIPLNATGSSFYFVNLGAGQHFIKNEQYNGSGQQAKAMPIKCDDNGNLSRGGNGNAHYKNTRETWYGIPVTSIKVTIGATGYATLHLPFGVNLPEQSDLKAYVVSGVSATEATMNEVNCIPADQGVILAGSANTPYTLTINDAAAWDEGVINLLEGSNMHENISAPAYVLSQPAGKEVGLYKAAMTDGSWLNNDNKAYLPASEVPNEAKGLSFVFDTETSIKGIDAAKADNSIYDLSGRRVKNAQKGIFIVNGKKVIK